MAAGENASHDTRTSAMLQYNQSAPSESQTLNELVAISDSRLKEVT